MHISILPLVLFRILFSNIRRSIQNDLPMKYTILLSLIFLTIQFSSLGQTVYPISTYHTISSDFAHLLLTNEQIENNDTVNEKILDLAEVMVHDSMIERIREHHHLFLIGWFIHTFGHFNWRAINPVKEKFVGTVRSYTRSAKERYSELDINFNLYFHLDKYLWHMFRSVDIQRKIARQDIRSHQKINYAQAPYIRDSSHIDMTQYRLHCELTPARHFRSQLHDLFYPIYRDMDLAQHINFGSRYPSMGFYGVNCLDCNHSCHSELHPYEWLWWMNLHTISQTDKTWLVGLMKDGSSRFHHWSHNPKTGRISIPFALPIYSTTTQNKIRIDHLVYGSFVETGLISLHLPSPIISPDSAKVSVLLQGEGHIQIPIEISFNHIISTPGLRYWLSDINWDGQHKIISGYFNMATSVIDGYTMRVTFSRQ